MSTPTFTSRVRVTRERPPLRTAELLETGETVTFGTPGYQGDFYGFGTNQFFSIAFHTGRAPTFSR